MGYHNAFQLWAGIVAKGPKTTATTTTTVTATATTSINNTATIGVAASDADVALNVDVAIASASATEMHSAMRRAASVPYPKLNLTFGSCNAQCVQSELSNISFGYAYHLMDEIQRNNTCAHSRILMQHDNVPMRTGDFGNNIFDFTTEGIRNRWADSVLHDTVVQASDGSFVRRPFDLILTFFVVFAADLVVLHGLQENSHISHNLMRLHKS
jgi:hypothetical protein